MSKQFKYLSLAFLQAMDEIGELGLQKHGENSFQAMQVKTRKILRHSTTEIMNHARQHTMEYELNLPHDHFHDLLHQLAAAAFNVMVEAQFAHLVPDSTAPSPAGETAKISLTEAARIARGDLKPPSVPIRFDGVPEPVHPEGGNVIHVPRIPGTVNTPVGPMIPAPEAAAAETIALGFKPWRVLNNAPGIIGFRSADNTGNTLELFLRKSAAPEAAAEDVPQSYNDFLRKYYPATAEKLIAESATPIAPVAEKLIAELVSALESLREMCEDDCTGIDGRCPVCRAVNKADVALTRAAEYRKGAKNATD